MVLVEVLNWLFAIWLVLFIVKLILLWGQLPELSKCYAKVFQEEYSGKLMGNIFLAIPIIVSITAPILFLSEGWNFFFIYTKEEILKHLTDIRDQMSQM
jgi:hypothetical protein